MRWRDFIDTALMWVVLAFVLVTAPLWIPLTWLFMIIEYRSTLLERTAGLPADRPARDTRSIR